MSILNSIRVLFQTEPTGLDFSGIISALTGSVSAQQLIGYLAAIVGAGIGIYVAYVVVRKATGGFTSAVNGGKPKF